MPPSPKAKDAPVHVLLVNFDLKTDQRLDEPMVKHELWKSGPQREKTCLRGFANNTGADQPAHPRSLVSAFVIRFLESIICKLATG